MVGVLSIMVCDESDHKWSKRAVLQASGATIAGALAGCSGQDGQDDTAGGGNDDDSDGDDGFPDSPWTTEQLAEKAQEESETNITLYNAINAEEPWVAIGEVIQEEYPWFELDVFASTGEAVGQRVSQEMQTGDLGGSVLNQGGPITKDKELANRVLKSGHNERYAIMNEVDHDFRPIFDNLLIAGINWGPSIAIGYNPEMLEELGLDLIQSYNDLFDDQYEGMSMLLPQGPNWTRLGWIATHHAEEMNMEPQEWVEALADHLNFEVAEGYTAAAKLLGSGEVAPYVIQNYPWVVGRFADELPVDIYAPDENMKMVSSGMVAELAEAPNPWGARFLISVIQEPFVQKAMATNRVPQVTPGRPDIDYSDVDMSESTEELLDARPEIVPFSRNFELVDIGEDAWEPVLGEGITVRTD